MSKKTILRKNELTCLKKWKNWKYARKSYNDYQKNKLFENHAELDGQWWNLTDKIIKTIDFSREV